MAVFGISRTELRTFLERSLSEREKRLLLETYELQGLTFSSSVSKLSDRYPKSTVKLILRRLKHFNLVEFGNFTERGKPLRFTPLGEAFFDVLKRDEDGKK